MNLSLEDRAFLNLNKNCLWRSLITERIKDKDEGKSCNGNKSFEFLLVECEVVTSKRINGWSLATLQGEVPNNFESSLYSTFKESYIDEALGDTNSYYKRYNIIDERYRCKTCTACTGSTSGTIHFTLILPRTTIIVLHPLLIYISN